MTFAAKIADVWSVLPVGQPVTLNEISVSWETLMLWSDEEREAFGVFSVPDPDAPPSGKVEASRALKPDGERPEWVVVYVDAPPPAPEPVPASVSAAQACLILEEDGLLAQVETIVAAMPKVVQIWFARANTWERFNPYVMGIGLELDLADEVMDDKFRRAARRL